MPDRYPKPWRIREAAECFVVEDGAGFPIAYLYFTDREAPSSTQERHTRDNARRIASQIAKLGQ